MRHRRCGAPFRNDITNADDHQGCLLDQLHGRSDALLGHHDLFVIEGIGKKRNGHEIGFSAGLIRQFVNDIVRVGGIGAGQTTQHRDETHILRPQRLQ